jgi:hypothetical protein
MATSWTDISGLIDFQRTFLTDISNNAINVVDARTQISGINANLVALQSSLSASGASLIPTLTFQADISNILQTEKQRLDNKKTQIDAAYMGQKRMISLNDSLAARKKAYNYMLLVVVIVLFVYMGLIKIKQFVPEGLGTGIDILIIALFVVGFAYCFKLFLEISNRNNMDFEQIDLAEPKKKSDKEIQDDKEKARKEGRLTDFAEADRKTETTCADGSTFNTQYQICLPEVPRAATDIYSKPPTTAAAADKKTYSSLTAAEKTSVRIFKADGAGFYWGNVVALCGSDASYNSLTLKCKAGTEGFSNAALGKSEAAFGKSEIKPYSPTEWTIYSQYNIGQ